VRERIVQVVQRSINLVRFDVDDGSADHRDAVLPRRIGFLGQNRAFIKLGSRPSDLAGVGGATSEAVKRECLNPPLVTFFAQSIALSVCLNCFVILTPGRVHVTQCYLSIGLVAYEIKPS